MSNNSVLQKSAGTSFRRACLNIEAVWRCATPADIERGARWYGDAERIVGDIARLSGDRPETVAAVIAQLSPRTTWSRNVAGAYALCCSGRDMTRADGILRANYVRAARALLTGRQGGDPVATINGPKTRSFARNILGDRSAVTVDIWAARIALDPEWSRGDGYDDLGKILDRSGVYGALANAYRVTAARLGIDATTLQASTWIVIRNGRAA